MLAKQVFSSLVAVGLCASIGNAAMVLRYEFEAAPGNIVADISGSGTAKDLTLNNGASIVTDVERGNVLSLDGVNDYGSTAACTAGDKLDTQNSITMMGWINTTTTSRDTIASRSFGPGPFMELNTTGYANKATAHVGGPGLETYSTTSVNDESWHHLAMTYDASTLRIFVDGFEETSAPGSGRTDASQTLPFLVGALGQPTISRYFGGLIDDLRVYNTVLDENEIQAAMAAEPNVVPEPGSALLWFGILAFTFFIRRRRA